jgi:hypothetical protein
LIENLFAERVTVMGRGTSADAKALTGNCRDRSDLRG